MQTMMSKAASRTSLRVVCKSTKGGAKTVSGKSTASSKATSSGKGEAYEYALTLPGVSDPFPEIFDPANFLGGAKIADVRRWRESELVHGRVAMLAALGFVVGENLEDFPAFYNFDGNIAGPAIYQFQQVEARGAIFWEPLVLCIGLAESWRVAVGWANPTGTGFNALKDDYNMGEIGFDPLGLKPEDPEELKLIETKELNNGRLAMIAIAGFTAQELVNGREIFEHLFLDIEKEIIAETVVVEKELGVLPK
ncbi:MAG: stress-related chlorophyll a/b-binding protein 3 [Monoraphidium minutum]|nr:MAG: stress-related chlorophyll a/b-binding protein 3 [Monoraphidium minutum]